MADSYVVYCRVTVCKPWWVGDPDSDKWQGVMGGALDTQIDYLAQARAVRYALAPPGTVYRCPTDALQYLASERRLERVPTETEEQWRTRLDGAWDIHHESGTSVGHAHGFAWASMRNVTVLQRNILSTPPEVGSHYVRAFARAVWAQFDIVVQKPHQWERRAWGDGAWGEGTWGSTMTADMARYLQRQVRERKSGHDTCTYVHFALGHGPLWGTGTWGTGTWGSTNECMTMVVGEDHWAKLGRL